MPTTLRFWKPAILVTAATVAVCLSLPYSAKPDPAVMRTILSWQQHREAFQQFECEFRVIQGTAASREAALRGELEHETSRTFLWSVDGDRERCTRTSESENNASDALDWGMRGLSYVIRGDQCTDFLMANGIGLSVGATVGAASIAGSDDGNVIVGNEFSTPFTIGMTGDCWNGTPLQRVQDSLKEGLPITATETKQAGGTLLVALDLPDDRPGLLRYEFLPDQGMLLRRLRAEMPGRRYESLVTDWQETPAGMFPTRGIRIDEVDGVGVQVEIVEVESLQVGTVEPERFQLTLPAGTWVNSVNEDAKFQLHLARHIGPADLPSLLSGR